jgi:hypothetical protein
MSTQLQSSSNGSKTQASPAFGHTPLQVGVSASPQPAAGRHSQDAAPTTAADACPAAQVVRPMRGAPLRACARALAP